MTKRIACKVVSVLSFVTLGIACHATRVTAEPAQSEASRPSETSNTPLIPRRAFFGNPARYAARISPSGKQISFLAPVDGVMNIWVGPADDIDAARAVTRDKSRGIQVYQWSASDDYLLYLRDAGGDENDHVNSLHLSTGTIRDLTPDAGARAEIYGISWRKPGHVVVGINNRNPDYFDVYRVDIADGSRDLLLRNEVFSSFIVDEDLELRAAIKSTEEGGGEVYRVGRRDSGDPELTKVLGIPAADFLSTTAIDMSPDNRGIYLISSLNRDKAALIEMSLTNGDIRLIAEDDQADVDAVFLEPTTRKLLAYAVTYTRREWHAVEKGFERHLADVKAGAPGDMYLLGQSNDGNRWMFWTNAPDEPVPYFLYERDKRRTVRLFISYPELIDQPLRSMSPVVLRSRDGLSLVSYLTLPSAADRDGDGKPEAKSPLVLNVHGGPWARDLLDFLPEHQWLANRGYAVLSVNYRGSTGFGKSFVEAAVHEWAGKMHDDLIDAVDWAIGQGITDRDTVGIMGYSYGGYAALVGLTFTPDRFACGVDAVGPSNLETLLNSIPPYWKSWLDVFTRHIGDRGTEAGRALLQERSPLNRVDAIRRPLLIGQGGNDPRVKQTESDQIVAAMQAKQVPVTYVLFPDEGHGFARPENNIAFYGIVESFLSKCLGGRYEPLGDALAGSSTRVPTGAEYVPGLSEALKTFQPTIRE